MKRKLMTVMLASVLCLTAMAQPAEAVEVSSDAAYCFGAADFTDGAQLAGICITALPDASAGTVMLGSRILRAGDVLTAQQMAQMTFHPAATETDRQVQLMYLPIYRDRVESVETMSIDVIGRTDQAPVAEDSAMETYKNLPNEALLKVKDPEGQNLTFTVVRKPKRGEVVIREDGSFHYTPEKNKVGIDSFTYTATDPAGNVSREATVTVTVTKPADSARYTDTAGEDCRFAAEWMKNTGIFVSESVGGNRCFQPDKNVSRGEFLTMLVGLLELEPETAVSDMGMDETAPAWLKPYLAAAMRSGLLAGIPAADAARTEEAINGAEVAVLLQNALDLSRLSDAADPVSSGEDMAPEWAVHAMDVLAEYGIVLDAEKNLTRGDAAQVLYQVSLLIPEAPGTAVLRSSR